ncbi:hypothetical protein BC349_12465 [Flavihumibacter stibioxidans]|uniref:Uncharacterized protein n=1 Tax=Flavihumibacter stibioxidans TaxID=1834163 RepID=A0ABR7MA83_9BACT|nr:hypothetical protein [Flavihumibacter stibioxidans]
MILDFKTTYYFVSSAMSDLLWFFFGSMDFPGLSLDSWMLLVFLDIVMLLVFPAFAFRIMVLLV